MSVTHGEDMPWCLQLKAAAVLMFTALCQLSLDSFFKLMTEITVVIELQIDFEVTGHDAAVLCSSLYTHRYSPQLPDRVT